MFRLVALIAAAGLFASAKPVPAQEKSEASKSSIFLFTTESRVGVIEFNGSSINLMDNKGREDHLIKPTWIVPSKSGYLVSDANQGGLLRLRYDEKSKTLTPGIETMGSIGTSHMTYNKASTRLFAATGWGIEGWDTSAPNGKVELLASEPAGSSSGNGCGNSNSDGNSNSTTDTSSSSFTTHIAADPSGKIMVISDRAANTVIILDVLDDNQPRVLGTIVIAESCGPRRGAFYAADGENPTRYFALCQFTKELLSFEVDLSAGTFRQPQRMLTSVETTGDKRSVADLVLHSNSDRSADIYITNTWVGNASEMDTISHFRLPAPNDNKSTLPGELSDITADRIVSSQGISPNSITLDPEGQFLVVTNQHKGPGAIAVLKRDQRTGALSNKAEATLGLEEVTTIDSPSGFGPVFVTAL